MRRNAIALYIKKPGRNFYNLHEHEEHLLLKPFVVFHLEAALEPVFRLPVPVVGRIEAQVGGKGVGAVALRQFLQQAGQLAQALPLILIVQDLLASAHQALRRQGNLE